MNVASAAGENLHNLTLLRTNLVANPVLEHVLQFERIVAKHLSCLLWILGVPLLNILLY